MVPLCRKVIATKSSSRQAVMNLNDRTEISISLNEKKKLQNCDIPNNLKKVRHEMAYEV